ncbi:MAG: protein translocase SEC61 complex subunit gamma [Nitrososphaerales archaeon]
MKLEVNLEKRFRDMYNTLKLAKKGGWDEYKIHLKLVLLGMGVVGAIGFIIQFISSLISFSGG